MKFLIAFLAASIYSGQTKLTTHEKVIASVRCVAIQRYSPIDLIAMRVREAVLQSKDG